MKKIYRFPLASNEKLWPVYRLYPGCEFKFLFGRTINEFIRYDGFNMFFYDLAKGIERSVIVENESSYHVKVHINL